MVWLDGLDVPMIKLLDASFAEPSNAESQSISRPVGDSPAPLWGQHGSGGLEARDEVVAGVQLPLHKVARDPDDPVPQR